ncbi:MAG: lipopolysaccharide biosynthesis protein [Candidatus Pseudomonas colombiensis]|nr:MAG: lipopolysaccharide biosynthesis protein [Pseudomonas sp.]
MISGWVKKSDFLRNILTLLTGTVIAQAIPILISPLLTRIYTPEDFGVYALYIAVVNVLVVLATGQYENAILLPRENEQAYTLVVASSVITLSFTAALFLIVVVFHDYITSLLKVDLGWLLYLIPLGVCISGLLSILNYWNSRKENYKRLSTNSVLNSVTNGSLSVVLGYVWKGGGGLAIAQLSGLALSVSLLLKEFFCSPEKYRVDRKKLVGVCVRYKKFPQISIPHGLFSNLSNNLPAIILTAYFSPAVAGFYFLAFRVAALPLTIIGNAFYQVFFQQLSKVEDKKKFYKDKFLKANLLLIPVFVCGWFLLPALFHLFFGEAWIEAGKYTQVILPLLYMKFLSNVFCSAVYIFFERQAENFFFGVIINLSIAVSLIWGARAENIELALLLMMASNSLIIIVKLIRCRKILEQK